METFEGQGQFRTVFGHESCERYGKVVAHGHFTPTVVLKAENLLVGFPATFAQQHLGVLQHGSVDRNKAPALELLFQTVDQLFLDALLKG
ncbi:hypothetical protein SDC9_121042 [bioreactor metagenome]|uniref:Uncharacterized protein n=1 Tax=bioreactor metagenome TaxID=1076179 RepID=A0A645CAV0_9ZZZZ